MTIIVIIIMLDGMNGVLTGSSAGRTLALLRSAKAAAAAIAGAAAVLAGCAATSADTGTGVRIQASFYPLQWISEQVGGSAVAVSSLTPPGAEPHDLELSPTDVAAISDADLVVYLADFQPAIDDAVSREAADSSFDAADHTDLDLTYTPIEEGRSNSEDVRDPHFWLDPLKLADVADALADRLAEIDAGNAALFTANAAALRSELQGLDAELRTGLAECASRDLVTSHNAFGYLAHSYGLTQRGITGLTPEEEPSAGGLADIAAFVQENDVRTIYFETLVSPDVAQTVADEADVSTAVLDPLEGLTDASAGSDYPEVMRSNLATLRQGQRCQ